MPDLLRNLRFGARMLAKSPGFASAIIATLALGIGANTAVFTVTSALLLRPFPYRRPATTREYHGKGQIQGIRRDPAALRITARCQPVVPIRGRLDERQPEPNGQRRTRSSGGDASLTELLFYARGAAAIRPRLPGGGRPARGQAGDHPEPTPCGGPNSTPTPASSGKRLRSIPRHTPSSAFCPPMSNSLSPARRASGFRATSSFPL